MTGSEKFDHILTIVGALVPLLSAVSSLLNHVIRSRQAAGQAVSPVLAGTGSVLNLAAVNLDKAVQLGKMAKNGGLLAAAAEVAKEADKAADPAKPADPAPAEPPKAP